MRGKSALVFVVSALSLGVSVSLAGEQQGLMALPAGAKYCPLPGSNNDQFMRSYFAMDAKTGQVSTVSSIENQPIDNSHLDSGEVVLMVVPSGSYENVFVPPEQAGLQAGLRPTSPVPSVAPLPRSSYRSPQAGYMPLPQYQPQPVYMPQGVQAPQYPPMPISMLPEVPAIHSEVANQSVQRVRQPVQNDERIPWWKGGMWRNKGNGDDKDDSPKSNSGSPSRNDTSSRDNSSNDTASSRSSSSSSSRDDNRSLGRAPRILDDDEMWDDEEYTGYNSDGSFGRSVAARREPSPPRQQQNPYAAPPAPGPNPQYPPQAQQQPMQQPMQQPQMYAPGQQAAAPGYGPNPYGGGYPAPAPAYGGNPYDTVPTIVLNSGAVASDPYASTYAAPTYADPYATSTGYPDPNAMYGSGYDAGGIAPYTAGGVADSGSWPLAGVDTTPPSYQGSPSIDAQGSPQFENAVRLVKDNRFSEAKAILVSETSRNPSNAAAWRWLADCSYNLLELDEAVSSYQRALERDPNDYYALRGQGFSYLHRGHEYWRRMQDEVGRGEKETAAATFAQAHENYKKSLEMLGLCLRRAPNDGEAIYGEAMAAEGASRKLYSNAISYLKLGPDQRERAELFAENCLTVINKGIERSKERAKQNPGDAGPRALLGGLYLRKAILYNQLGKNDLALIELRNSRDVQNSILDEIDKNNETAKRNLQECETYWEAWGGNR